MSNFWVRLVVVETHHHAKCSELERLRVLHEVIMDLEGKQAR